MNCPSLFSYYVYFFTKLLCIVCSYRSTKPKPGDTEQLKTSGSTQQQLHAYLSRSGGVGGGRRSRKLYDDISEPGGQGIDGPIAYSPISVGLDGALGNVARFRYVIVDFYLRQYKYCVHV